MKNDEFRLLVGQTWDVISPLYPGMLMYSVGWDAGDIGYRRAQVRGERYFALSDVSLVDRTTLDQPGSSGSRHHDLDQGRVDPDWPLIEGRAPGPWGTEARTACPITIGRLRPHRRRGVRSQHVTSLNNRRRTWSGNIDFRVPITERLGFQGECQVGENLGPFLGGIGQGIDPTTLRHDPRRRRLVRVLVRLDAARSTATSATRLTIPTTTTWRPSGERKLQPVLLRQPDL